MNAPESSVVVLDAAPLLQAWGALEPPGDNPDERPAPRVRHLLPAGFEAYLRIFHRFESDASGDNTRWSTLAALNDVIYHSELSRLTFRTFPDDDVWVANEGELDDTTLKRLDDLLLERLGISEAFVGWELALQLQGDDPLVLRGPWVDLMRLRDTETEPWPKWATGPEFTWPTDWSWAMRSDYDLTSTYLGCDSKLAEQVLRDDTIEALEVHLDTRVDSYSDRINRPTQAKHWHDDPDQRQPPP